MLSERVNENIGKKMNERWESAKMSFEEEPSTVYTVVWNITSFVYLLLKLPFVQGCIFKKFISYNNYCKKKEIKDCFLWQKI